MTQKILRLVSSLFLALVLTAVASGAQPVRAAGPWYVTPTGDDNNDCLSPGAACATIDAAIGKASAGETVNVAMGTYIGTSSAVVLINKDIALSGGWDANFTTQSGMSTIDGEAARRGITVNGGVTTTLERFVLQNSGNDSINGGGLRNEGTVTVNNSTIIGNTSGFNGGGGGGGGISNLGTVTVNNSTISGNFGGGISNWGIATLNNSTVNGNMASMEGGGIGNYNGGMVTLNNSTISGNTASTGGGIFVIQSSTIRLNNSTVSSNTASIGGGIYDSAAVVFMQNTLLAGNTASSAGPDCIGSIGSSGYNLIGDASNCNFTATTGDMTDLDPFLGPLQDNGGLTFTQALPPQSPAIDSGNITGCSDQDGNPLTSDQRGVTRPQGIACDIGAYEYLFTTPGPATSLAIVSGNGQSSKLNFAFPKPLRIVALDSQGNRVSGVTVTFTAPASGASGTFAATGTNTTTIDTDAGGIATTSIFTANNEVGDYTVSASATGLGSVNFSLRNGDWYVATIGNDSNSCFEPAFPCATINGALNKSDFAAGDTIRVAVGTYTGTSTEVVLIDKDITLSGGWDVNFTSQSGMSTIDGQGGRRGITVNGIVTANVENIIVQNGFDTDQGAGIFNTGSLTISDSIIRDNITSPDYPYGVGGGIFNASGGILTLNNSIISGNTAAQGAGIMNACDGGDVTLNSSTIRDNKASGGGGGIVGICDNGMLILNDSAILNNTAVAGGGIFAYARITLNRSSVSGNIATSAEGGGIDSNGDLTLINSTISGNTAQSYGGGIYHGQGALILNSSTVSANATNGTGGGVYQGAHTATIQNSIIAGNIASSGADCAGNVDTIVSSGYNLIGSISGCDFTQTTGDLVNVDANLGSLIGLPGYHSLLPGSPAINAGNPTGCTDQNGDPLTTDQRGAARVGTCDIGAYEYTTPGSATTLSVVGGDNQSRTTTLAFPKPLQVATLDNIGSPVSGVTIEFTAPASGASGTFADTGTNTTTVNTDAGGVATTSIFTANDQPGSYTVSASAPGLGSVNFSLDQVFRPANDNFGDAEAIALLPFTATVDITNTTNEPGEFQNCFNNIERTVWYSFTPTETMAVRADTLGSAITGNVSIFLSSGPGISDLNLLGCAYGTVSFSFYAEAGKTYYLQAGPAYGEVGNIQINLEQAFPPANDDFADAEAITTLPFTSMVDITNAVTEPSEPGSCTPMERTVWYSFTPAENMVVQIDMLGSAISGNVNTYLPSGPGISDLSFLGCSAYSGSFTFNVEAGRTYYLQAGSDYGGVGNIQINLAQVLPPPNDDFASAISIDAFPSTTDFTNIGAIMESGEPGLSCDYGSPSAQSTVWFSFTATQDETISASIFNSTFSPVWAVYTGTGLNDLTELGCRYYDNLSWRAIAGQTYYIQVSGLYGGSGTGTLSLDTAADPQAYFYFDPFDPSTSETIQFYDYSYDPAGIGIETWEWDFGDGTPLSTDQYPTHIYAAGGDFNVTLTVKTFDGRSASTKQTVQVRTQFTFTIDIKPGSQTNPINPRSSGKIPVVILSSPDFNAPLEVDRTSLTFGSTGDELSLVSCNKQGTDVNGDGLRDLVCHFKIKLTGFKFGDTEGILKGQTLSGVSIEARDVVRVLQASYP